MKKSAFTGAILASAVALAFMGTNVQAQTPSNSNAATSQAKVKCAGGNDCSGQSACKTSTSPGPGENSCKGQGFVMTKSAKACQQKGGKAVKS
ncbi:MAG: BufA2 family periplasmic bufferin-type metallophore [Candidatus Binataceae bacterium]